MDAFVGVTALGVRVNLLDLALAGILIVGLVVGLAQGLVRQGLALGSVYVAAALAVQYYQLVGGWLVGFTRGDGTMAGSVAAGVIFLVVTIAVNWLGRIVFRQTALPAIRWVDRLGGGALGVLCAWVILGMGLSLLGFGAGLQWGSWEAQRVAITSALWNSQLAPAVASTVPSLFETMRPWLPLGLPAPFAGLQAMAP